MGNFHVLYDHDDVAILRHIRMFAEISVATQEGEGRMIIRSAYGVHDVDARFEPAVSLLRSVRETPLEKRLREDAVIEEIETRDRTRLRNAKRALRSCRRELAEIRRDRARRNEMRDWTEKAA